MAPVLTVFAQDLLSHLQRVMTMQQSLSGIALLPPTDYHLLLIRRRMSRVTRSSTRLLAIPWWSLWFDPYKQQTSPTSLQARSWGLLTPTRYGSAQQNKRHQITPQLESTLVQNTLVQNTLVQTACACVCLYYN